MIYLFIFQLFAVYLFEYVAQGCAAKVRPKKEYNIGCPELYAALSLCYQVILSELNLTQNFSLCDSCINPIALRKAKIAYNFGLFECKRVKVFIVLSMVQWSKHKSVLEMSSLYFP